MTWVDGEPLPYKVVSIEDMPQEQTLPSTSIHWSGLYFYQIDPLPPLQTMTHTHLPDYLELPMNFMW